MDPNATLEELRRLAAHILSPSGITAADAIRLAKLVQALDSWISRGGFLPAAWRRAGGEP